MSRKPPALLKLPPNIHTMSSDEALPIISAATGGRCLASFSCGKDSVGVALSLRRFFPDLQLFHLYDIPDLRIAEEGLQYFERLWGRRIIRLPQPALHSLLNEGTFQPLHRMHVIEAWGPLTFDFDDVATAIRDDLGWGDEVPMAVGVRMADSIFRRAALKKTGVWNVKRHVIYPIFDWDNGRLLDTLTNEKVHLPCDYPLFGRSFDGLDERFIGGLSEYYPDDYAKVRFWFPLIGAERARYKFSRERRERERYADPMEDRSHIPQTKD